MGEAPVDVVDSFTDAGQTASLRTNVSEECAASMIELHL